MAAHPDVPLAQRRDPVRPRHARVAIVADAKPAEVDEPQRDRADTVTVELAKRSLASDSGGHLPRGTALDSPPMRDDNVIVVLEGDQTGQELLEEALRVLAPDVIGIELEFPRFDLSLASRRASGNGIVY